MTSSSDELGFVRIKERRKTGGGLRAGIGRCVDRGWDGLPLAHSWR